MTTTYSIFSTNIREYIGEGLSRGELNQWLVDAKDEPFYREHYNRLFKNREDWENYIYSIPDEEILGEYGIEDDFWEVTDDAMWEAKDRELAEADAEYEREERERLEAYALDEKHDEDDW